ncbi:MAG TPA: flagellar basal body rod protein FlgB [Acidisarcina sp.]
MADAGSTSLIPTIERYLSLTNQNQQRITSNMANIDTPGYHTQEINFQQEMHRAVTSMADGSGSLNSSGLNSSGLETVGFGPRLTPASHDVKGLLERPDGNNVSLDREGLMLSQSQLQYAMGVQLVKHEFHQMLSAINGGS